MASKSKFVNELLDDRTGIIYNAIHFTENRGRVLDLSEGPRHVRRLYIERFLYQSFTRIVVANAPHGMRPPLPECVLDIHDAVHFPYEAQEFDLILCLNTFFFLPQDEIQRVLAQMKSSLKIGGILAFNLLGEFDDWEGKGVTHFTRQEVLDLGLQFPCIARKGTEEDYITASGKPKVWHMWDYIYKKTL